MSENNDSADQLGNLVCALMTVAHTNLLGKEHWGKTPDLHKEVLTIYDRYRKELGYAADDDK